MDKITLQPHLGFDRVEGLLHASEAQINKATIRALNKTAHWLQVQIARQSAQNLKVPVSAIKNRLLNFKAKPNRLWAMVALSYQRRRLYANELGAIRQTRQGSRAGKHLFKGAFTATMPKYGSKNNNGIYKRKTKKRLPIKEEFIDITLGVQKAMEAVGQNQALLYFEKTFNHELKYILSQ